MLSEDEQRRIQWMCEELGTEGELDVTDQKWLVTRLKEINTELIAANIYSSAAAQKEAYKNREDHLHVSFDTITHSKWEWYVRGFYTATVKYPKIPLALAIEIGGNSKEVLQMDIDGLISRKDIGEIILTHNVRNGSTEKIR